MTVINFDAIKTDKISLHHFKNENLENAEPTYTLYINSGKIDFKQATRFCGSISAIGKSMWATLDYKIYQRTKKMLTKFVADYPDCEYQVYWDKATDFTYFVAQEERGIVVRCKMRAAANARFTDYYTGSIEERDGVGDRGKFVYDVHSMNQERRAFEVVPLTPFHSLQTSILELDKTVKKGDMMEILSKFSQVATVMNQQSFEAAVDEETLVLTVGDYHVNGIITKNLQASFYTSVKNDNFERFNNACGVQFDGTNNLSTPSKAAFKGKVWITDLDRELNPGEELYEQEVKAREIYYDRIERIHSLMTKKASS